MIFVNLNMYNSCPSWLIWISVSKFKSWMDLPKCSWRQCSSSPGDLTRLNARFRDSLDTKCTKSVIELAYYDALKKVKTGNQLIIESVPYVLHIICTISTHFNKEKSCRTIQNVKS